MVTPIRPTNTCQMPQKYLFMPSLGLNPGFSFDAIEARYSPPRLLAPNNATQRALVTYFDTTTLTPFKITTKTVSIEDRGLIISGRMDDLIRKIEGYERHEIENIIEEVCKRSKLAHFLLALEGMLEPKEAGEAVAVLERLETEFKLYYQKPGDVGADEKVSVINRFMGEPNSLGEALSLLRITLQDAWRQLMGDKSKFSLPFLAYEHDEAAAEKWHERAKAEPELLDSLFQAAQIQMFLEKMGLKYKNASYGKPISLHEAFLKGQSNCETSTELFAHFALIVGLDIQLVKSPGHAFIRLGKHDLGIEGTCNFQLRTLSGNYKDCRFSPVMDAAAMRLWHLLARRSEDHKSRPMHRASSLMMRMDPDILEQKIAFLLEEDDVKGAEKLVQWLLSQEPDYKFSMEILAERVLSFADVTRRERCNLFMYTKITDENRDMDPMDAYMRVTLRNGDVTSAIRFRESLLKNNPTYAFDREAIMKIPDEARKLGLSEAMVNRTVRYLETF